VATKDVKPLNAEFSTQKDAFVLSMENAIEA